MFERLANLFKALFNKGVSSLETPEVLAEQAQGQLETSAKKVKEAVTTALANEKLMEQQIKKNQEELTLWETRAATAVGQGNDEMARQCLQKKAELNQQAKSLAEQLAEQKRQTAALKDRYAELDAKLKDFMKKKSEMTARANANEALAKANELLTSTPGSGMEKWEQKVREKEARSEAIRELSMNPLGGGNGPTEADFKALDRNNEVEDELARLKAQIAVPKITMSGGSSKPQVDDNLPMVVDVEVIKPEEEKK